MALQHPAVPSGARILRPREFDVSPEYLEKLRGVGVDDRLITEIEREAERARSSVAPEQPDERQS